MRTASAYRWTHSPSPFVWFKTRRAPVAKSAFIPQMNQPGSLLQRIWSWQQHHKHWQWLLWPPCVADADIIFLPCGFFYLSFFFYLFFLACSKPSQIECLPYFHTWCGLSANLGCRSETCCTRLAENTGRKKSPKIRHLGTIAQLCRAIYSQLRHVSTIAEKNLSPPHVLTIWWTSAY